jgi:hypothetical protein
MEPVPVTGRPVPVPVWISDRPVARSLPVDRLVRSGLTGLDRYRSSKIRTGPISGGEYGEVALNTMLSF